LIEALTKYRREVLTIFGLTLHNTVAYYIPIIYMTSYIVSVAKLAPSSALWIGTSCLLVFVILIPCWGALSDRIGRKPLLLIAQMVMIVFLSFFSGACPAVYSEILSTRVRYTALSIGYNIAVAVFGGLAPFIATWLIGVTGSNLAPSYYLIAAATITFLVVLRIPETASRCVDRIVRRIADCCFPQNPLSFPSIRSGGIRVARQNQRIIRCDVCDHRVYPDEAHRRA